MKTVCGTSRLIGCWAERTKTGVARRACRYLFAVAVGVSVFGMSSGANASIIYDVNRMIGGGTVTGFIETDGTLGVLASGNIVNWSLTLTSPNLAGRSPDVIDFATQTQTFVGGGSTTATPTQLIFDFDGTLGIVLQGSGPANFWCMVASPTCFGVEGEFFGFGTSSSAAESETGQTGLVVFATARNTVVPEPASLAVFLIALGGLGFMMRRRVA